MSEDTKRSITGGAVVIKPTSDDRKSTLPVAPSGKRVIIKSADMKDDMQKEAVEIAIATFERNSVEKDVAERIKKEFDKRHGPTWHCIVGSNFGVSLAVGLTWLDSFGGVSRFICDSRNKPLCLFLFGSESRFAIQIWLMMMLLLAKTGVGENDKESYVYDAVVSAWHCYWPSLQEASKCTLPSMRPWGDSESETTLVHIPCLVFQLGTGIKSCNTFENLTILS
ncbi:hypothetical protein JRO89_XS03G0170200 [Xanthoceras sorbifolium]|uniref:Dynein light chain n=1 Tax=Xanthoceras sorbifolium TaxID=99658 RepID=A0ABQ8IA92_9ROSI|nr:hypothetical protein JRO89_XS03G0170200 [Xanthoceras sorbifolium]